MFRLWQEVEQLAAVNLCLAGNSSFEQRLAGVVECAMQEGKESNRLLGQDLAVLVVDVSEDGDTLELGFDCSHFVCVCVIVFNICSNSSSSSRRQCVSRYIYLSTQVLRERSLGR